MPTAADEFEPPGELIQAMLVSEVVPMIELLEKDGCPKLGAQVFIAIRDLATFVGIYASTGEINGPSNGELRIRMRKTGNENRVVWRIESIFPGIMPSTGFSGFDSRGNAIWQDGQWTIRPSGWTGKYNVGSWHGWV